MASLADCVRSAIDAGRLSREDGDLLAARADDFEAAFPDLDPATARTQAEVAAINSAKADVALQMRQKALQTLAVHTLTPRVLNHKHGVWTGLNSVLSRDVTGEARATNVDYRGQGLNGYYNGLWAEGLNMMRFKHLGFSADRKLGRDVVRELFGESTGNADARMAARQFANVAELMRKRFNRAGGQIPKRADWGLPQHHDQSKVMNVDLDEWLAFTMPKLDRQRMTNEAGIPYRDDELRDILKNVYEDIRTGGLHSMNPGQSGARKLANRHQEGRFLAYRSPDDWIAYQERFGSPDTVTVMTDHISKMSREIALLEVMGPNPTVTYRYLRDVAAKKDPPRRGVWNNMKRGTAISYTDSLFNVVNGHINTTHNVVLAEYTQAMLNLLTSAKLGSATLSQISDQAFMRRTALWNGLPAWRVFQRQFEILAPTLSGEEYRMFGVRLGLGAESWIARMQAASRFTEVGGTGIAAKAAEAVMRASGMNALTNGSQKAIGVEVMGLIGENSGRAMKNLEPRFREALERYGITREDWNILRKTKQWKFRGAKYFAVEELMKRQDLSVTQKNALASKIQEMVLTETTFAVPVPDARVRAITTGGLARGTVARTVLSSVMQFKSFPISVIALHGMRGFYQNASTGSRLDYLSSLIITTTIMGAVALTAKDISAGRNPRPTDDAKFWAAAFVQGGGAGLLGDFLFSEVNRFGKGISQTFAGPGAQLLDDLAILSLGSAQAWIEEGEVNIGARAANFLRGYTPGGNLWYTRLATERAIFDQLQLAADPVATRRKFRNIEKSRLRDYGQDYFWSPGKGAPREAPQLGDSIPDTD